MAELTGEEEFELQAETAWHEILIGDPIYHQLKGSDEQVMDLCMHCFKIGYAKGYVAANEEADHE